MLFIPFSPTTGGRVCYVGQVVPKPADIPHNPDIEGPSIWVNNGAGIYEVSMSWVDAYCVLVEPD